MTTDDISQDIPEQRLAWDDEYRCKGSLWGKTPLEPTTQENPGIFLDLGCGNGKNLRDSSRSKARIGLDFSIQALRLCRKKPDISDAHFICADARFLPFKNSCIHHIDAHHILGHLLYQDRTKAACEVTRVLKPGGELLVTVFGTGDFRSEKGTMIEDGTYLRGNNIITHYFSKAETLTLFPELRLLYTRPCSWTMQVKNQNFMRFVWVLKFLKPRDP
ncbi:MAG: class I SAM-dependent methyltransferase [Methanomicrobiales archaeon]|jgi:ubiquinone/menaquinone biosynthesis C-methylase UbiE|nr:class I SAM-dependent methyltransferase [Methanomicrobiales archaeon]